MPNFTRGRSWPVMTAYTPGILLTAEALLAATPTPSRDEIREALAGNLCRCTGYTKILDAVELAALRMRGAPAGDRA